MQRLFGGKKSGNGITDGRKTPDSMPATPQISSTSANINGAPSADQRFLSELAVILSEEEEAKKREEAEKQQQEQQAKNNITSNASTEETTPGSTFTSDEIDSDQSAPTNSTEEPQKQAEGKSESAKDSGETDKSSSKKDVAQSINEKPLVMDADSEENENYKSSAEIIEVFDTKAEPSSEAANTDRKEDDQCITPVVDKGSKSENEVQPEGFLLESEDAPGDADASNCGLENPSSPPLATPAAEEPPVVTSTGEDLVKQGNDSIERGTKKESAPIEGTGVEEISNDISECSTSDKQGTSPVTLPEVDPSGIARESEQANTKAELGDRGNLSVDQSTANSIDPQISSGTEGRPPDSSTAVFDDQNKNASKPLAAATGTEKDAEASAKQSLIEEGAGDSQTSSPLNDATMGPQSALETIVITGETTTGLTERNTDEDSIIAARSSSGNDVGGGPDSGGSEGPIPEGQSEVAGDTAIGSANSASADATTKSNAGEKKIGEFTVSAPENCEDLIDVNIEGSNSNLLVVVVTDKESNATKEESEQANYCVPDTNGVQHSQHDDTTKTEDESATTTEESPGNVISEHQHDASLLPPKKDPTRSDSFQPEYSVATGARDETGETDLVESENGPLRMLEAAETKMPACEVKSDPASIATGQDQMGEAAGETAPILALEGEGESDTSPRGGTSESDLESVQNEQSIDFSSAPALMNQQASDGKPDSASVLQHDVSTSEQGDKAHNDHQSGSKAQDSTTKNASISADADVSIDQEDAVCDQQHLGIIVEQKHEPESEMESMFHATASDSIERKSSLSETEPLPVVDSDENSFHKKESSLEYVEGDNVIHGRDVPHVSAAKEVPVLDQADRPKSEVVLNAHMNETLPETEQSLAAHPSPTSLQMAVKGINELDNSETPQFNAEEKVQVSDQTNTSISKMELDIHMSEMLPETKQFLAVRPNPTSLQMAVKGKNKLDDGEVPHVNAEEKVEVLDQTNSPQNKAVFDDHVNMTLLETKQPLAASLNPTSLQMAVKGDNELDDSGVQHISVEEKVPVLDQTNTPKIKTVLDGHMNVTAPETATSLQEAVSAETVTTVIQREPNSAQGGQEEQEMEENESVPEVKQSTSPTPHDRIGAFSFPGFPVPTTIQSLRQGTADDLDDIKASFQRLVATTSSVVSTLSEVAGPAILTTAANARDISAPVLGEASTLASFSADAASDMVCEYRRKRDKNREEQNLIVSFAQYDPEEIGLVQPSTPESTARPSPLPGFASIPPQNSPAGKSDMEQNYRNEVSQFLAISPNRDSIRSNAADQQRGGSITGQKRLDTEFANTKEKCFQDPILTAAIAGSEARKKHSNDQLESRVLPFFSIGKTETSSMRQLTHFAASTATAMASVARPALQDVRDVAAAVRSSVKGGTPREEEVLVVGKSADGKLQLSTVNGRRVLSAVGVSFEKMPLGCDVDTLSLLVQSQEDGIPTDQSKETKFLGGGLALKAMSSAGNLLTHGILPVSGFASPTFVDGSLTPLRAAVEVSTSARNSAQKPADVLNNPKDFMDFLASRLQGHGASDGWTKSNRAAAKSVFAHERKTSWSSSISSPDSPGVLSIVSDSDDESDQNSLSTTNSPTKPLRMPHPAAPLWDMVDETHAHFNQVNSNGMSLAAETPTKPSSAVSFDLNSPMIISAEVHDTAKTKSTEEIGIVESAYDSAELSKDNTLPDLMAPFENPEKKGGSNLTTEPILAENFKDKEFKNIADVQVPITRGDEGETSGDFLETKDNVPFIPPRPQDGDEPISNQKIQMVSHRRRRDSDSRLDQSLALRAVKSADVAFDEGDSMSVSGYISLPGGNDHDNGSVHRGNRPSRHNLGSPQDSLMGNASFSGSRRGSLYSTKKSSSRRLSAYKRAPSSRRLLREGSVNLFPPLRAIESGEIPALRHSRSENNLMLTPNDDSDPSISFQAVAPDLDDFSGVGDGGGMFELAHSTFSAVAHSNILEKVKFQSISDSLKYLASVRWHQLVANWKHLTLAKALTERACSPHYQQESNNQDISDEEEVTVSTGVVKSRGGSLDLLNFHQRHDGVIHPESKNLNGLVPHLTDGDIETLSNFLVEFGSPFCPKADADTSTRKPSQLVNIVPESTAKVTADTLAKLAASDLKRFASFMEDIVHFAAHNGASSSDDREPEVSYSVGLKSQEAIEKKSQTKYGGDLLQVKDALRAQITFGDEGSLVAGLLRLVKRCKSKRGNSKDDFHVEVARVKNLFQRSPSGSLCVSSLPTGYRHVLITVRLNGLLLAEIQFQLAEMFEVLGFEGYFLHREILDLDEACKPSSKSQALVTETTNVPEPDLASKDFRSTSGAIPAKSKEKLISAIVSPTLSEKETKDGGQPPSNKDTAGKLSAKEGKPTEKSQWPQDSLGGTSGDEETNGTNATMKDDLHDIGDKTPIDDVSKETNRAVTTEASSSDIPTGEAAASDTGSLHMFGAVNREEQIAELKKEAVNITEIQLLQAVKAHAIQTISSIPRDVASFHCLHYISTLEAGCAPPDQENLILLHAGLRLGAKVQKHTPKESDEVKEEETDIKTSFLVSKECLLRCLAVSNQGISIGMTGWLEYGATNSFGRMANGPLIALRELSFTFASLGEWHQTIDALQSLIMKCDQQQPLYHPTTLLAMLDLAGVARVALQPKLERATLTVVATRLAFYLAEQEHIFFSRFGASVEESSQKVAVLQFNNSMEGIPMLEAFVELFESQLSFTLLERVSNTTFKANNDILLGSHALLADSLTVLANCILTTENFIGVSSAVKNTSRYYWRKAFEHYEITFKGKIRNKRKLNDSGVVSAAYGMARCLRELGMRAKALKLLSSIVSALGRQVVHPGSSDDDDDSGARCDVSLSFLPYRDTSSRRLLLTNNGAHRPRQEHFMALLLWLMAVISVEDQQNEQARMRALSLLHAASETLRTGIAHIAQDDRSGSKIYPATDGTPSYDQISQELLSRVEQEAKDLLEVLADAVAEAVPKNEKGRKSCPEASWDDENSPSVMI